MIRRKSFMPGSEVEDLSVATFPAAARTQNFAALKPGHEDEFVRRRNTKRLAIHLFMRDLEIRRKSLHDRMARITSPNSLFLARFAPNKRTSGTDETFEHFG